MVSIILIICLVFLLGAIVGGLIWAVREDAKDEKNGINLIEKQEKEKQENMEKIISFLNDKEKVTNNDIKQLLGVSEVTACRYLDELEKKGVLKQVGKTGRDVYYSKT